MKILLLGTGASEGIPAFRCRCETCDEARKKGGVHMRQNAAALVTGDGGERILLDIPLSIKMMLNHAGVADDRLDAIFITHSDFDHIGGLFNLQQNTNQNGFVGDSDIPVYMPGDVVEIFQKSLDLTEFEYGGRLHQKQYAFHVQPLQRKQRVQVGGTSILPLESNHLSYFANTHRDCFGYLLSQSDGRSIAYFPDALIHMPEETYEILQSVRLEVLFIDCTFASNQQFARCNHLDIDELVQVRHRIKPKRMFATHISHRNLGHDRLTQTLAQHGIEVAYDGLEISL